MVKIARRELSTCDASSRPRVAGRIGWWLSAALAITCTASGLHGQSTPRSIWDGVYSAGQAARGKQRYEASCGYCHRDDLSGGGGDEPGMAPPPLVGDEFLSAWVGSDLGRLVGMTSTTMPYQRPKLEPAAYRDIISYILKANGAPAGAAELPEDPGGLSAIAITLKPKD